MHTYSHAKVAYTLHSNTHIVCAHSHGLTVHKHCDLHSHTQSKPCCCLMLCVFFKKLGSCWEDDSRRMDIHIHKHTCTHQYYTHQHTRTQTRTHQYSQSSCTAESNMRVSDQSKLPRHLRLQREKNYCIFKTFPMFFSEHASCNTALPDIYKRT